MEDKRYATFSDVRYLNTGIAATAFDQLSDQGRFEVTGLERDLPASGTKPVIKRPEGGRNLRLST